ncbi:MAG: hypothetical protein IPK31_16040 [Chitinophagaceae bacterium]|nr:hypothetical protein [Chitinophagaceae bacterium]
MPAGYDRVELSTGSFGNFLRNQPLKQDKTVYLYNGSPKYNQRAQYAVLNVSVGSRDLQQCADAVMRLRAEYLKRWRSRFVSVIMQGGNIAGINTGTGAGNPTLKQYLECAEHCH